MRGWSVGAIAAILLGVASGDAVTQSFPERPLKIVVGFAPGGPADALARIAAQILSEGLTQTVIVGLGAIGMTLIIIAGGIDLSVGSVMGLSAVTFGDLHARGAPIAVAILAALAVGGLVGALPPGIATRQDKSDLPDAGRAALRQLVYSLQDMLASVSVEESVVDLAGYFALAVAWLSARRPIAQTKPTNSRATAVATLAGGLR
jgi:hypothetical protein